MKTLIFASLMTLICYLSHEIGEMRGYEIGWYAHKELMGKISKRYKETEGGNND